MAGPATKLHDFRVSSHASGFATILEINLPASIWTTETSRFHGPELSDFVVSNADQEAGSLSLSTTFRTASWNLSARSVSISLHAVAGSAVAAVEGQRINVVAARMVTAPGEDGRLPLDSTTQTWHWTMDRMYTSVMYKPSPVRLWFTVLLGDALSETLSATLASATYVGAQKAAQHSDIDPLEAYVTAPVAQDVCFRVQGRHLWANKRVLASRSSLWRSMFAETWANGYHKQLLGLSVQGEKASVIEAKLGNRAIAAQNGPGASMSDSTTTESEVDGGKSDAAGPTATVRTEPATIVDVQEFTYTVMRALLVYVVTDKVVFRPIAHAVDMTSSRASAESVDFYSGAISAHDLYEAAHFYGLGTLQALCLQHVRRSFGIDTISYEFLCSTIRFPDVRDAVVSYVLENYDLIEATDAWDQVHERLEDEREDTYVPAMAALARLGRLRAKQLRLTGGALRIQPTPAVKRSLPTPPSSATIKHRGIPLNKPITPPTDCHTFDERLSSSLSPPILPTPVSTPRLAKGRAREVLPSASSSRVLEPATQKPVVPQPSSLVPDPLVAAVEVGSPTGRAGTAPDATTESPPPAEGTAAEAVAGEAAPQDSTAPDLAPASEPITLEEAPEVPSAEEPAAAEEPSKAEQPKAAVASPAQEADPASPEPVSGEEDASVPPQEVSDDTPRASAAELPSTPSDEPQPQEPSAPASADDTPPAEPEDPQAAPCCPSEDAPAVTAEEQEKQEDQEANQANEPCDGTGDAASAGDEDLAASQKGAEGAKRSEQPVAEPATLPDLARDDDNADRGANLDAKGPEAHAGGEPASWAALEQSTELKPSSISDSACDISSTFDADAPLGLSIYGQLTPTVSHIRAPFVEACATFGNRTNDEESSNKTTKTHPTALDSSFADISFYTPPATPSRRCSGRHVSKQSSSSLADSILSIGSSLVLDPRVPSPPPISPSASVLVLQNPPPASTDVADVGNKRTTSISPELSDSTDSCGGTPPNQVSCVLADPVHPMCPILPPDTAFKSHIQSPLKDPFEKAKLRTAEPPVARSTGPSVSHRPSSSFSKRVSFAPDVAQGEASGAHFRKLPPDLARRASSPAFSPAFRRPPPLDMGSRAPTPDHHSSGEGDGIATAKIHQTLAPLESSRSRPPFVPGDRARSWAPARATTATPPPAFVKTFTAISMPTSPPFEAYTSTPWEAASDLEAGSSKPPHPRDRVHGTDPEF